MTARKHTEVVKMNDRAAALLDGRISAEDLDDQELMLGQTRENNGTFSTISPKMIPRQLRDELHRRLLSRGDEILKRGYILSTQTIMEAVQDPNVKMETRLKAAMFVVDKIAPDKIEVVHRAETPIEQMLREAMSEGGLVVGSTAEIVDTEQRTDHG